MQGLIYLVGQLVLLWWLGRVLTQSMGGWLARITRKRDWAIWLFALVMLPGTLVHELSHLVVAVLTGVDIGKLELAPVVDGKSIRMGSVEVRKSDWLRMFLVAIAPLVVGFGVTLYLVASWGRWGYHDWRINLLVGYLIFAIGNTMFSSKEDIRYGMEFGIAMIVVAIALYVLGVDWRYLPVPQIVWERVGGWIMEANRMLKVPIVIDVAIILGLKWVGRRS